MSIWTRLRNKAFSLTTRESPIKFQDGQYWWSLSSTSSLYNEIKYIDDFLTVPELNAVINRKARMWSRMRIRIVSKITGQDVKNYEYLVKVLRNPNWYQAQKEFLMQTKLFREIHGNEYLYFNKALGMPFKSVKSLYTLPPANMIVKTPQEKPFYMYQEPVISYQFQWGNDRYDLDAGSVIQFNDNRVNMSKDNWVTGQSKLDALKFPINNIKEAYKARNIILRYRGAAGFVSPEAKDVAGVLPLTGKEQEKMQEAWSRYGTGEGQFQFVFAPQPMRFQPVTGNDPNKLGLFTEIEEDFMKIVDSFGMDRDMFGNQKGATFENKKQGERSTWNNTIIPEALEWVDGLNDVFNTGAESWRLVADFVDIPVLQENISERGAAIKQITDSLSIMLADRVITPEEYQQELNKLGFNLTVLPPQDREDNSDNSIEDDVE